MYQMTCIPQLTASSVCCLIIVLRRNVRARQVRHGLPFSDHADITQCYRKARANGLCEQTRLDLLTARMDQAYAV